MNINPVAPTLPKIDELTQDTLVIAHFADERPLRGVGGLVDWRLNGRLSALLLEERMTGAWGEQLLYPQGGRLPVKNLLYFGLGDRTKFGNTRFKEVSNRILKTLMRIGVWSFAISLPGREALKLVPRQLIDLWLSELSRVFVSSRFHELEYDMRLLEPVEIHAELEEQLDLFAQHHGVTRHRR